MLLVVAGILLFHETRGRTLFSDEWSWALERRGNDLDSFLSPHNEHLSLVPVAIYKLLFATAGLSDYTPYRLVLIGAHFVCVLVVFVYGSRRVGSLLGLLSAALILFFGQGWQVLTWPFQMAWLISLSAGVGSLLMLDRNDGRGDVAASALLALALASSGLGLMFALGVLVEVLWGRRGWRRTWIVAAPLAVYASWWLAYQPGELKASNILAVPTFVADAAAAAVSAVLGLGGTRIVGSAETPLGWGRPLAIVAAAVILWRLVSVRPIPPRVVALLTIAFSFWALTGLARADFSLPWESRYMFVGGLLLVLLAVELARGVSVSKRVAVLLVAAVGAAVVSNVGTLRVGALHLRADSQIAAVELGTLELARPVVRPDFASDGFPFGILRAGPYFATTKELGSPAATSEEIARETETLRRTADTQLIRIHEINLQASRGEPRPGRRPALDAAEGGVVSGQGACFAFLPVGFSPANAPQNVQVTVPPTGLSLTAHGGPAVVSVRRFADGFPDQPVGTLAAGARATLRIRPDLARRPWHLRVVPARRATICGLR